MEKMSTDQIREILLLSQQHQRLIEVYNFADDDTYNVGTVVAFDTRFVVLATLDWDAKMNGLTTIRLASIHAVRDQSDYLTTVAVKAQVAKQHGYFDVWGLEDYLATNPIANRQSLLLTMLHDAVDHHLPVVIGTKKYKGRDDFAGIVYQLNDLSLLLHYYNAHDLSSLWEYEIPLGDIDYLRTRGSQGATTAAVLSEVFGVTY